MPGWEPKMLRSGHSRQPRGEPAPLKANTERTAAYLVPAAPIARNPLSQPPRHALLPGGEDASPLRRAQPSSARGSRKRAAPTGAPPASPPRPLLAGGPLPPRGAGSAPAGMGGPSAVTSYLVAVCQDSNPRYTLNPPSVPAAVATRHSCLTLSGPKH